MQSDDILTKYSCLLSLKKVIKGEKEGLLPFEEILGSVMPAVLVVCDKISRPNLVWPVVNILTNIVEKVRLVNAEFQCDFDLLSQLNLDKLLENNDKLIKSALIDMFTAMIESVPFGTNLPGVYEKAFVFIQRTIEHIEPYDTDELSFWYIVVKELPTIPQQSRAIDSHYSLLNQFIPVVDRILQDEDQLVWVVKIVEESLLIEPGKISFE